MDVHNYIHDVAGGPHNSAPWQRLTRSGDTITGYESDDGKTRTVDPTARRSPPPRRR
jgi:hypothetical protein